jgi:hypothetical protein
MTIPVLAFAPGVTLVTPPRPAGSRLLGSIERAARACGVTLTVTCGSDSHPKDDPHTLGEAFDIGVAGFSVLLIQALLLFLRTDLGPRFYVQYEVPTLTGVPEALRAIAVVNPGATGPHLHAQRAKSTVYPPV